MEEYKDCLACTASFSEEAKNENDDKLWCIEKQCYVEENNCCEKYSN